MKKTVSIEFALTEYNTMASGDRAPVDMGVQIELVAKGDKLVQFLSVQTDEHGTMVSWTRWGAGDQHMLRWDRAANSVRKLPPPTEPSLKAVMADSIGPTGDPMIYGYTKIGPDSYESREGLGIFRIHSASKIERRTFEAINPKTMQVQSRIHQIKIGNATIISEKHRKATRVRVNKGGTPSKFLRSDEPPSSN
ncbi:hypothetical protein [Nonomuraea diastatica]|uniref:Uncharacterized protein n=1 Tax=Nonomuraea diastatica TaxID=1848329 RepID=A0A4R4WKJ7_9ACTN|nr:hypothetical protein [Nonomuraea diastatica]TDD16185.1 hypothetical protein E1294_32070 [Nonomuraea diastatica]